MYQIAFVAAFLFEKHGAGSRDRRVGEVDGTVVRSKACGDPQQRVHRLPRPGLLCRWTCHVEARDHVYFVSSHSASGERELTSINHYLWLQKKMGGSACTREKGAWKIACQSVSVAARARVGLVASHSRDGSF